MSLPSKSGNIVRSALLSIWGMVTLILLFTLGLLMYELYQQGESPIEIALGAEPVAVAPKDIRLEEQQLDEVSIFYASQTGFSVTREVRRVQLSESTVKNCRIAMTHLIDGPNQPTLAPIMSNKTKIRGMYLLENGELVIDFSRDLEAGHIKSASAEVLLVQGIAQTMFQPSLKGSSGIAVSSIRFLFEGAPYQHSFPAHVDLSDPVRPNPVPASSMKDPIGDA